MNRLLCKLTGGHRYADANLRVYENSMLRKMCFCNRCVKCNKEKSWSVTYDRLFNQYELYLLGLDEN